jgi:hypothetical protein
MSVHIYKLHSFAIISVYITLHFPTGKYPYLISQPYRSFVISSQTKLCCFFFSGHTILSYLSWPAKAPFADSASCFFSKHPYLFIFFCFSFFYKLLVNSFNRRRHPQKKKGHAHGLVRLCFLFFSKSCILTDSSFIFLFSFFLRTFFSLLLTGHAPGGLYMAGPLATVVLRVGS